MQQTKKPTDISESARRVKAMFLGLPPWWPFWHPGFEPGLSESSLRCPPAYGYPEDVSQSGQMLDWKEEES